MFSSLFNLTSTLSSSSPRVPVMKQKMVCRRVTPLWARRVPASPCTPPSPRAREESPSSTARTRTTTCRPRRCHGTPPSPAKGEKQEWVRGDFQMVFSETYFTSARSLSDTQQKILLSPLLLKWVLPLQNYALMVRLFIHIPLRHGWYICIFLCSCCDPVMI